MALGNSYTDISLYQGRYSVMSNYQHRFDFIAVCTDFSGGVNVFSWIIYWAREFEYRSSFEYLHAFMYIVLCGIW
jgi:hypothetical protein